MCGRPMAFRGANRTHKSHVTYETYVSHRTEASAIAPAEPLVRNESRQFRSSLRSNFNRRLLGFFFRAANRHHDAHHRSVRTAPANAIDHRVDLAPVLAGQRPAAPFVPIEHQRAIVAVLNHVT